MTSSAMLADDIKNQFHTYFTDTDHFILAISGGADSMALLALCNTVIPDRFCVVTIDHSLRIDSHLDTELVASFCHQHNISVIVEKFDLPKEATNENLEAIARQKRYQILHHHRQHRGAAAVVTAHHHQDQLETQVMHMVRGCAIQGLIGMKTLNAQKIFRPLLKFAKQDLLDYTQNHQIPWREDSTNVDTNYQRNRFRQQIIPQMSTDLLDQVASQASNLENQLQSSVDQWFGEYCPQSTSPRHFLLADWLRQPLSLRLRILYQLLTEQIGIDNIGATYVGQLHQWCIRAKRGSIFFHQSQALFCHQKMQIIVAPDGERESG